MSFAVRYHESDYVEALQKTTLYPSSISSTTAAYGVLFLILIYYILHYLDYTNLPLSELLWNSLVYITPSRLVSKLDSGFETAMAEDPHDDTTRFDSKGHASKSNAVRRILGLDRAGFLTTVQRTRTLSDLGSVFKGKLSASLPGLGNWDHSCYQNSVLQGLAALESLPGFLDQVSAMDASQPTKAALKELTEKLNDPENVGKTFWTPAELKSMSSWQQQDAQEYFSKILDEIEKDTAKAARKKPASSGLGALASVKRENKGSCSQEMIFKLDISDRVSSNDVIKMSQLPEELAAFVVRNPLEGLLAQRVGCQQCGFVEGLSLVPFNCLTVPLGKQWMYDVRSCLDEYTALEPISGVECAKCTLLRAKTQMEHFLCQLDDRGSDKGGDVTVQARKNLKQSIQDRLKMVDHALDDQDFSENTLKKCQIPAKNRVSTTKSRQAVVARAPRALVVHVNRSNFDEFTGVQSKNHATVRFPQQLDLAPWCLGQSSRLDCKDGHEEIWNVDPSKSMLSDDEGIENLAFQKAYQLRAVISHYGRHENGHYICYRRSPRFVKEIDNATDESTRSWWRLSDEDVTEVSGDTVLAQGGVFMLFYEQPELPPHEHQPVTSDEPAVAAVDATPESLHNEALHDEPEVTDSFFVRPEEQLHALAHPTLAIPSSKPAENKSNEVQNFDTQASSITDLVKHSNPPSPILPPEPLATSVSPALDSHPASTTPPLRPSTLAKPQSPKPASTAAEPTEQAPLDTAPNQNQAISPPSMRTAGPRSGRGSVGRAGKAMGSVAGFVQAN
ncbi:hypothetical protein MMC28_006772 [Mycoblastus sanguinarius]|nr:hypothetical protein [Mycoblastus sanguinarius]